MFHWIWILCNLWYFSTMQHSACVFYIALLKSSNVTLALAFECLLHHQVPKVYHALFVACPQCFDIRVVLKFMKGVAWWHRNMSTLGEEIIRCWQWLQCAVARRVPRLSIVYSFLARMRPKICFCLSVALWIEIKKMTTRTTHRRNSLLCHLPISKH